MSLIVSCLFLFYRVESKKAPLKPRAKRDMHRTPRNETLSEVRDEIHPTSVIHSPKLGLFDELNRRPQADH